MKKVLPASLFIFTRYVFVFYTRRKMILQTSINVTEDMHAETELLIREEDKKQETPCRVNDYLILPIYFIILQSTKIEKETRAFQKHSLESDSWTVVETTV